MYYDKMGCKKSSWSPASYCKSQLSFEDSLKLPRLKQLIPAEDLGQHVTEQGTVSTLIILRIIIEISLLPLIFSNICLFSVCDCHLLIHFQFFSSESTLAH